MSKPVILTGLRANNDLTIGNYFGAILPMIDMATTKASDYQINMFVPDLHSFTTPINHRELHAQIAHNIKLFVAAGLPLDHPDIHIYRQSYIPAHSELTWILDCFTGFGEMSRMTQFKDKMKFSKTELDAVYKEYLEFTSLFLDNNREILQRSESIKKLLGSASDSIKPSKVEDSPFYQLIFSSHRMKREDSVSVGLFNYPVLMAADILLYGALYVPVGEDQTQHLEFARDIAIKLNNKFNGEFPDGLFTVPVAAPKQHEFFGKDQGLRIKDLADPTKKMSKSDDTGKGVIFLGDTPEAAVKKVMSATTDSLGSIHYDKKEQPGIANLLDILALLTHKPVAEVTQEWEGNERYGDLKKVVAEAVSIFLTEFQGRLSSVDEAKIAAKLAASEKQMAEQANATLLRAQQAVGLREL